MPFKTRCTSTVITSIAGEITESDGPGPAERQVNGIERTFFDYDARKVTEAPDDGTIAPWAAALLPFAPEIVLPTFRNICETYP